MRRDSGSEADAPQARHGEHQKPLPGLRFQVTGIKAWAIPTQSQAYRKQKRAGFPAPFRYSRLPVSSHRVQDPALQKCLHGQMTIRKIFPESLVIHGIQVEATPLLWPHLSPPRSSWTGFVGSLICHHSVLASARAFMASARTSIASRYAALALRTEGCSISLRLT